MVNGERQSKSDYLKKGVDRLPLSVDFKKGNQLSR